jgi:hypothetical protein
MYKPVSWDYPVTSKKKLVPDGMGGLRSDEIPGEYEGVPEDPYGRMVQGQNMAGKQIGQNWEQDPELYYNMFIESLNPQVRDYYKGKYSTLWNNWLTKRQTGLDQNLMADPFGGGMPTANPAAPGGFTLEQYKPPTFKDFTESYDFMGEYAKNNPIDKRRFAPPVFWR